jgi:uncharacterized Fe-S cluster-containing protein
MEFNTSAPAGETSCREDLHAFNPEEHLLVGDIFRY